MNHPSKDKIREKYGITETDFLVLTQDKPINDQTISACGSKYEKAGVWDGFEVWMKRSILGNILLAVIFIGSLVSGIEAISKYGTIVWANHEQIVSYVSTFANYATEQTKGVLAYINTMPTAEDMQYQQWPIFPTGTQLYPISGSWHIG
jgi:hypothetical protein